MADAAEVLNAARPSTAAHWARCIAAELPGFTPERTQRVDAALDSYFEQLSTMRGNGPRDGILSAMQLLFAELDSINRNADGTLLETDERELLVTIIIDGAVAAGLNIDEFEDGDPTMEFRNF